MASVTFKDNAEVIMIGEQDRRREQGMARPWITGFIDADIMWQKDGPQLIVDIAKENFEQLILTFVLLLYIVVAKI
ncbi:AFR041W-Ap [Eremothecium gossypii ATCC 10895]|uniref:AFR041W-Ap n=1 Tax=Eremothecium gossypii (strain ATCC 10895 / CBS 109.51 / FGSC 9923 / NRRL Y-1056) TaxID=284811 RepID=D8FGF8_EREGS|nr:AFR041W-Ap [Eremothecium gossypii ATCC 10895]ADJ41788.1 AFR041W-Ap [Eremothecium gossypii ATCC 10895]AEY97724.1 FAFR041W-Ap [Eremothecium gossypii FDAG1]AGO13190.1 AaceriAFR041WAp [[Ashbya] aceris (nom. inval.)]